jgi:hypothetical protein
MTAFDHLRCIRIEAFETEDLDSGEVAAPSEEPMFGNPEFMNKYE